MKKNSQTPSPTHKNNKKLALHLSIATALMTGYGVRPVWAGTCVGAGGTYNCTGPANATDVTQQLAASDLTVTTQAGFGIDTSSTGNEAFFLYAPSGSGNLIFTDTHQSTITGQSTAIRANNYNDGYLSILTNGTLTSNTDYGISVYQATSASHVTITAQGNITAQDGGITVNNYGDSYTSITTSGIISTTNDPGIKVFTGEDTSHVTIDAQNNLSGSGGINVLNYGSGFTHITTSGWVDGGADVGIFARNDVTASDISITTNSTVTAQDEAISANAYGYGGIQITANGAVTSVSRNGIDALNQGIGAVNVTTRGVITSDGIGINAYGQSGTTGITVNVEADIQSNEFGVLASNAGILNTQVTVTSASIVSGTEDGIRAIGYQNTRALTVETVNGGSVSGNDNGIYTRNYGDNATTINTTGMVSGSNGVGIAAFNEQTATDLTVTSQSTVSGSHFGVNAQNEGVGSTLLNLAGLVSSNAVFSSAVNVRTEPSTTYANIQTAGVSSQHNGIRLYHYGSGSSQVTTYGDIFANNGAGLSAINGLNSASLNITTNAPINSEIEGILARNYGNAPTQVILNNSAITSNNSNAVEVVSYIGNSDVSIHSYGQASINGHYNGISGRNYDGGSLLVSTQGPVYGVSGTGINTRTDTMAQNHTIEASGSVQGQSRGIEAFHYGTGNLMVTTQSTVTSSSEEAIRLFNSGNGSSQLVSQGLITSYGGTGISSYHANHATDLAVNVQGGVHAQLDGIEISNNGTGFSEISISGATVTSITGNGVNAYQGSNSGVLTIVSSSAISGQTYGIYASSQANSGTNIIVSASVNGQTGRGIYTYSSVGQMTTIHAQSGANIQNGMVNNHGDSQIYVVNGATLSGAINLSEGSDVITLAGGNVSNVTVFDGGDDVSSVDGYIDVMTLSGWSGTLSGALLTGWETIQINNTSSVQFNGTDSVTTEQMQVNAGGVLSLQDNDASDDLTIQGGFLGGGSVAIDAVLAGDGSASDVLRITGDTSGNTTVNINNLGGAGSVTTSSGILVIDVSGTSNGTFSLAAPINVNGYEYNLVKVDDDFYLQGQAVDADLAIDKTLQTAGPYYQDDEIVYEMTVTNNGPLDANNVVVTDSMTNLSFVSVTGGNCIPASFPCTISNLANGASATLTVTATIDAAGAFDNSASVAADEPDNNTSNNIDNTGNGGNAMGRYQIGVTVTGLASANEVTLQNNGTDDLIVDSNNTLFNFSTTIKDGEDYDVSISSQPTAPNQTCDFTSPNSGTVNGADVTFITINCSTNTYFVGGTVSGLLPGNYMVLQNNGIDDKIIMGNGSYVFDTPIEDETTYDVTIDLTPIDPIQPCQVFNANDNIMGNDVTDVDISCEVGDDLIFRNGFQLPPPPPPEQD